MEEKTIAHNLFTTILAMSSGEHSSEDKLLLINYGYKNSPFGQLLIASTSKGICYLAFGDDKNLLMSELKTRYPQAEYKEGTNNMQENAMCIFNKNHEIPQPIILHIKGTEFQLKVWDALLRIPWGYLTSYGELATSIGHTDASRAVGTAVGYNPVAFIVPCHRVIRSNGKLGGYHWGLDKKKSMLLWENDTFLKSSL